MGEESRAELQLDMARAIRVGRGRAGGRPCRYRTSRAQQGVGRTDAAPGPAMQAAAAATAVAVITRMVQGLGDVQLHAPFLLDVVVKLAETNA